MGAQSAGKQAIAVGDMDFVFRRAARRAQGAGDNIGPVINIVLRIAHHRRLAGSPRGRVDAHHLLHRHRKGIKGVVVAQILLGGAGKLAQIAQFVEIVRMNARRVEFTAIHRHIVVGVLQGPLQTLGLQGLQLVARCAFNRV